MQRRENSKSQPSVWVVSLPVVFGALDCGCDPRYVEGRWLEVGNNIQLAHENNTSIHHINTSPIKIHHDSWQSIQMSVLSKLFYIILPSINYHFIDVSKQQWWRFLVPLSFLFWGYNITTQKRSLIYRFCWAAELAEILFRLSNSAVFSLQQHI